MLSTSGEYFMSTAPLEISLLRKTQTCSILILLALQGSLFLIYMFLLVLVDVLDIMMCVLVIFKSIVYLVSIILVLGLKLI